MFAKFYLDSVEADKVQLVESGTRQDHETKGRKQKGDIHKRAVGCSIGLWTLFPGKPPQLNRETNKLPVILLSAVKNASRRRGQMVGVVKEREERLSARTGIQFLNTDPAICAPGTPVEKQTLTNED